MALRRWRGVLAQEGSQTGDGRLIAANALEWAPLPLPLGWLVQEQHGDLLAGAVQIGTITDIARTGDDVTGSGVIDDEIPEGAELIRRLEAGSASAGNRVGLSIDPDNWAVELRDTTVQESTDAGVSEDDMGVLLLQASGAGPLVERRRRQRETVSQQVGGVTVPVLPKYDAAGAALSAAAGDRDTTDSGVLLMEDEAGAWLERYTRLRIRGVTACAVAAFAGAYLELDGSGETDPAPEDDGTETVVAAALLRTTSAPPRFAFELPEPEPGMHDDGDLYGMPVQGLLVEQPDGGLGVPVTFTEREWGWQVFGHAARWGQCHIGYLDECVTAPPSMAAYAHFHVGDVLTADGSHISTGALTANCDHAAAHLLAPEARDHYAHSGMAFADVRATNGDLGVWISGALRPSITDEQLRVLRASSLSGDWRRIGASLEFIAALAVNVPGFPIAREFVTASGLHMARASLAASAHVDNGQVMSLTASGVVQRCADCAARQRAAERAAGEGPEVLRASAELIEMVRRIELRTRHLVPTAAEHALSVVKRGASVTEMAADVAREMQRQNRVRRPRRG